MPTIFESQRYELEDIERMEQALSERIRLRPRRLVEKVANDHDMAGLVKRIQTQSKSVLDMYKDDTREQERLAIMGSAGNAMDEFYRMLKDIKDYRRRYPNEPIDDLEAQYQQKPRLASRLDDPDQAQIQESVDDALQLAQSLFSGEELYGRFLDLVSLHEEFINLRQVTPISYLQYLGSFDSSLEHYPRKFKHSPQYNQYITNLKAYLESFLQRTQPLLDFNHIMSQIEVQFQDEWNAHLVKGWGIGNADSSSPSGIPSTPPADHVFCQVCQIPIKNTVYPSHLQGKKHKKNAANSQNGKANINEETALCEFKIHRLAEILEKEREATKVNVERRAALTEREREIELETFEKAELGFDQDRRKRIPGLDTGFELDQSDDEDDIMQDGDGDQDKIYNPLKLPLGWDGKPIPYWLWKLHGLGIEYPCEICGNYMYMGRKAFEKHFVEARHIHGLKCLGINDPLMFREITSIQQALELWNKLRRQQKLKDRQRENAIEMEDDEGNVMSQRTYNDLKKQGLV